MSLGTCARLAAICTGALTISAPASAPATAADGAGTATPQAAAPDARPALATGVSERGVARWRLEGRRLVVRLRRPLPPAGRRGIGHMRLACGESVESDSRSRGGRSAFDSVILAVGGRARVRLAPRSGRRTLRVRLDADVTTQANWCGLRLGGANQMTHQAEMRLRRGTPVTCATSGGESVAENDLARVTQADRGDAYTRDLVVRACLKPDGAWQPLASGNYDRTMGATMPSGFTLAGTWVAWGTDGCALSRHDLTTGVTQPIVPQRGQRAGQQAAHEAGDRRRRQDRHLAARWPAPQRRAVAGPTARR